MSQAPALPPSAPTWTAAPKIFLNFIDGARHDQARTSLPVGQPAVFCVFVKRINVLLFNSILSKHFSNCFTDLIVFLLKILCHRTVVSLCNGELEEKISLMLQNTVHSNPNFQRQTPCSRRAGCLAAIISVNYILQHKSYFFFSLTDLCDEDTEGTLPLDTVILRCSIGYKWLVQ